MKPQDAPGMEKRRAADFERELIGRARTWIPSWSLDEADKDFGLALLKIAARFNSEVAERLDRVGEKMALGFLDWLGLPAAAARPARMPVVMNLTETATETVFAPRPTRMQVDAADATIAFETETDLTIVPGQLAAVVGVDPARDEYYLPPPGLTSLAQLEPFPTAWKLKNFAAPKAKKLQVDPGIGFFEDMLVEIEGKQFRIAAAKDDLITIDPEVPAGEGWPEGTKVAKVEAFRPFDGARNLQEHLLYIGDADLLNVEAAARIEVAGLGIIPDGVQWSYWGKAADAPPTDADARWRDLKLAEDPAPTAEALVLTKPKGELETLELGGVEGRWIRARLVTSGALKTAEKVTVRINPLLPTESEPKAITNRIWNDLLQPEVFVNSTSSPPDSFFPLGREPRMFDTLYLGSAEAFSKPGASAWVLLELGDSTFAALAALRSGPNAGSIVAGVGMDGALRIFEFDPQKAALKPFRDLDPLRPKSNGAASSVALDISSSWPVPIWSDATANIRIATWTRTDVWLWDDGGEDGGNWTPWGTVPFKQQASSPIDGLIYLPAGATDPAVLIALRDGQVWKASLDAPVQWDEIDTEVGGNALAFKTLAPILKAPTFLGSFDDGLVGISPDKKLYEINVKTETCTERMGGNVDPRFRPAAARDPGNQFAALVAADGANELLAYDGPSDTTSSYVLQQGESLGGVSVAYAAAALHFMATIKASGPTKLIDWPRPDGDEFEDEFPVNVPADFGNANGPPLILDKSILIPGAGADVFIGGFELANRITQKADIKGGLMLPALGSPALVAGDRVVMPRSTSDADVCVLTDNGTTSGGETLYPLNHELPEDGFPPVFAYNSNESHQGSRVAGELGQFELELNDTVTDDDMWLLIDGVPRRVDGFFDRTSNPRIIFVVPEFIAASPATGKYHRPIPTAGRSVSYLQLDPNGNGAWDATLLTRAPIKFANPVSKTVWASAFTRNGANHPILVVLDEAIAPQANAAFLIDAAAGGWRRALGDTSTNPELAWEYWDGESWLRISGTVKDGTNNLRNTGTLSFTVPRDIEPVDWSGKTNNWIRARLIGGDYGKDNVSVVSKPGPGANETTQTIIPDPDAFQPPFALHVGVAYTAPATIPAFLLTRDSGAVRNQSDANRTPGAMVEIFTPLSIALGRLDASQSDSDSAEQLCVPDCECVSGNASTSPKLANSAARSNLAAPSTANRRALYLGFTAKLYGQPVNLLILAARENNYDEVSPLKVDALIGNRFKPIIAEDETRALGETGLLKMTFEVAPLKGDLFGKSLAWLRVAPSVGTDDWKPAIAGIYPNAVWARSAETMTRELLGSSDGRPGLTVALARPPLLRDTLELRVKEPLGKDECDALTAEDPDLVKQEIEDLPGIWVLWKQVADPLDCGPNDRVYALDEGTGDVRFGDGRHGAIPPVGADSIVAFAYERTDPVVAGKLAANFVKPRQEVNLVSGVDGVEFVIAADRSSGGVGPETREHVLEFAPATLRHRFRAVSLHDFEDLVRQRSAEVVQARAFNRNGRVHLVVVTRGTDPAPSRAQQRELRTMLLEISPVALGARDALTITGPRTRRLMIELGLRVATLDVAGGVAKSAKERLVARFSTEAVGDDAVGWQLGRNPTEVDIAEALLDISRLDEIVAVNLFERDGQGRDVPWDGQVRADDLVMLAPEDVRVDFKLMEAAA